MSFAISFAAILAICIFLAVHFKMNIALTPLVTISGITIFMLAFGMMDILRVSVFLIYAFAVFCVVYLCICRKHTVKEVASAVLQPGFLFFIATGIFFFFLLRSKNAAFLMWDEFSFWGTSAKVVFQNGQLYTLAKSSIAGVSYPPALAIFSYYMQFLGARFSEWMVYVAYDIMAMAALSAIFARIKWKNTVSLLIAAAFAFFGIYTFWHCLEGLVMYATSYADFQIGFLFAGALLIWFSDDKPGFPKYIASIFALMLLPLTKDMGLVLGLVASGIMALDMVIANVYPGEKVFGIQKKPLRLVYPLLLMASVVAAYMLWTLHFQSVTGISRVTISYGYSALDMVRGLDPYFNEMLKSLWRTVGIQQLTTFGTMKVTAIVLLIVPFIFAVFSKGWRKKIRLASFSLLMLAGFVLYLVFLMYTYTSIFAHTTDYSFVSFPRYIASYSVGWLFAAIGVGFMAVAEPFFKKLQFAVASTVTALFLGSMVYYNPAPFKMYYVGSENVNLQMNEMRSYFRSDANSYLPAMNVEDRIYFVCQGSDDGERFVFNYAFLPAYTLKTLGGGNFISADMAKDDTREKAKAGMYDAVVDKSIFVKYLRENEADFLYVFRVDDYFLAQFRDMFDDGLMSVLDKTGAMYM
ncbi:MAG: hypothetical protein RSD39_01885, partial [Oscillospiraceae bacterium]